MSYTSMELANVQRMSQTKPQEDEELLVPVTDGVSYRWNGELVTREHGEW